MWVDIASRDIYHTYPQTKTPHNFHLINQNGIIPSFLSLSLYKEPISNFYFKKMILKKMGCLGCPLNY